MEHASMLTRRKLLRQIAGTAGAVVAAPYVIPSTALGDDDRPAPSERIVMGCIGVGGRGRGNMHAFLGFSEVQVVAVCDVRKSHRMTAKGDVDRRYENSDCADYNDFRDLVARDDIDVVSVATPDHWHALNTIAACQHGKDVFCEKPLSLTIEEGRAMVEAARRYGRVFSSGSQRVWDDYGQLCRRVQKGELGKIQEVFVNIDGPSRPCNLPAEPVPEDLDWDLWLGPAPWAPYNQYRCGGAYGLGGQGWRTWKDYSGGMMTDWGGHKFSSALFALGLDETGPVEVIPPDGKDHQWLTFVFENGIRMYHTPGRGNLDFKGEPGTEGQGPTLEEVVNRGYQGSGGLPGDFLHCVKTREKPFRDVEYGHRSATVCHLGNIAYWLNRPLKWDPAKEEFIDDEEANRMTWRPMREPWHI
jgi:predicted dehydrogenase